MAPEGCNGIPASLKAGEVDAPVVNLIVTVALTGMLMRPPNPVSDPSTLRFTLGMEILPLAEVNVPVPELSIVMVVVSVRPEIVIEGGVIAGKLVISTVEGCENCNPMVSGLVRITADLTMQVPVKVALMGGTPTEHVTSTVFEPTSSVPVTRITCLPSVTLMLPAGE
jgi:hypothetical protein